MTQNRNAHLHIRDLIETMRHRHGSLNSMMFDTLKTVFLDVKYQAKQAHLTAFEVRLEQAEQPHLSVQSLMSALDDISEACYQANLKEQAQESIRITLKPVLFLKKPNEQPTLGEFWVAFHRKSDDMTSTCVAKVQPGTFGGTIIEFSNEKGGLERRDWDRFQTGTRALIDAYMAGVAERDAVVWTTWDKR